MTRKLSYFAIFNNNAKLAKSFYFFNWENQPPIMIRAAYKLYFLNDINWFYI